MSAVFLIVLMVHYSSASLGAKTAVSESKKRPFRLKRSGDFQHLLGGQLLFCELQVGEHRGYGIARAPAQPPARGNPLSQLDFHTAMAFQLAPERLHRPIRQILPRGFGGERRVSANRQRNSRPLRSSKPEFIV